MISEFKAPIGHIQSGQTEQLLKKAAESDVISFAGALPSSALFPGAELEEAFARTMAEHSREALQYNWCEGYQPLREQIAAHMSQRGIHAAPDEILVTHGAQQALSLIAKLLVSSADTIALESPTYATAIQAFELQSRNLLDVRRDFDCLHFFMLKEALDRAQPRFLYIIPTGHNPTGGSLSAVERESLVAMTANDGCIVIEDDAYGELQYDRTEQPLKSRENTEHVFYVGSFSKILSPGLRVGWVHAQQKAIIELSRIKQAIDLQTGSLSQLMLSQYLATHPLTDHVRRCLPVYRTRRDAMAVSLRQHFPEEAMWRTPVAGFSFWIKLPDTISAEDLLPEAIAHGVAFDPGCVNFPCERKPNFMRLSFSNQEPQHIEEGIAILGKLVSSKID
jgi:2-aminoadipate transaminase